MSFCPQCGMPLEEGANHCGRCGAPLSSAGGPPPSAPPAAWPQGVPTQAPPAAAWPQGAAPPSWPQAPPPGAPQAAPPQGVPPASWPQASPPPGAPPAPWPQAAPPPGGPPAPWPPAPPPQGTPPAWPQGVAPQPAWSPPAAGPSAWQAPPAPAWPPGAPPPAPQPMMPHPWPSPSGSYPALGSGLPDVQAKVSHAFDQLVKDIRSFSFKWVVPVDTALSPEFVRNRSVWVMLVFGFLPLVALMLQLVTTPQGLVQLLEIYFALAWACYYYYFVARCAVDIRVGFGVMAFTALIGVRLVMLAQTMPVFSWLYAGLPGSPEVQTDAVRALLGFVFGVGVVEEGFKALPVLIVAFGLRRIEKPIDGIFYGAMSGLGFGIAEGTLYVLNPNAGGVWQILIRGTSLPFLHSLWSAIVGYFIALAVINRSRAPALVVAGFLVSIVLHGTYDWAGGLVGVMLCAFTYLLFVSYMERSQAMVAEVQLAQKQAEEQAKMQSMWQQQYGAYAMPEVLSTPSQGGWATPSAAAPSPPLAPPPFSGG